MNLSPREHEVMALVCGGYTSRDIGVKLHMSEHTVKTHLRRIYKRHGLTGRAGAIDLYHRDHLTDPPAPCARCARADAAVASRRHIRAKLPGNHPWSVLYDYFAAALDTPEETR